MGTRGHLPSRYTVSSFWVLKQFYPVGKAWVYSKSTHQFSQKIPRGRFVSVSSKNPAIAVNLTRGKMWVLLRIAHHFAHTLPNGFMVGLC